MDYKGVIIEESLISNNILKNLDIVSTKIENVTAKHKTPWLKQWTLLTFKIKNENADKLAKELSKSLEPNYWYADFKNDSTHYIVFPRKIFKIDLSKPQQYKQATAYGIKVGIPDYQLDFYPNKAAI